MYNALTVAGYIGAKSLISLFLAELLVFKGITTYIEPYSGMFNVGLNKSKHSIEIYNDINPKLVALFKVLTNKTAGLELLNRMLCTRYSMQEYDYARFASNYMLDGRFKDYGFSQVTDDIHAALYCWISILQSLNGQMQRWKGITKGSEELEYLDKLSKKYEVIDRLNGVKVLNMDALELIGLYRDRPDTMIYCDPVYTLNERTSKNLYEYEMADDDQWKFVHFIKDIKEAKLLVSGYMNSIYTSVLTKENGWCCYPLVEVTKHSRIGGMSIPKSLETEYIWCNYNI